MIFNASITGGSTETITCRVFDPAQKKWLTATGTWDTISNALYTQLSYLSDSGRHAGDVSYPMAGVIIEYFSGVNYLGEDQISSIQAATPDDLTSAIAPVKVQTDKLTFDTENKIASTASVTMSGQDKTDIATAVATATAGVMAEARDQAALARKIQTNKAVISADGRTVTIYDDDNTTALWTYNVSADRLQRTPA